ncbi:hypothetical protein IB691_07150 [Fangia hongkongensis]|nr:hypothetical protein [Fangia hongkongensis]
MDLPFSFISLLCRLTIDTNMHIGNPLKLKTSDKKNKGNIQCLKMDVFCLYLHISPA